MSLLSKQSFFYNRLHGLRKISNKRVEKRNLFVSHKKLSEDKSKESSTENVEKENNKQGNTGSTEIVDTSTPPEQGFFTRMHESRKQFHRDTEGLFVKPTNRDKVFLLWANKFPTRESIPEKMDINKMIHADNIGRVVIFIWMMTTMTIAFVVMIRLNQSRLDSYLFNLKTEQDKVWKERQDQYEEETGRNKK